jgi:N6-L-threonylcarbamoyladenine synthase
MLGREGSDFSFSGLKTAVRQIVRGQAPLTDQDKADLAASFQSAVVDVLVDRVRAAMQQFRTSFSNVNDRLNFVAAGGVAANEPIRRSLGTLAEEEGFVLSLAPPALCTDNGAMVAWAGLERLALGVSDPMDTAPRARWPLESHDNRVRGAGTGR